MTGTPKQIAWAEDLRQDLLAQADDWASESKFRDIILSRAAELVAAKCEAKWWIESRPIEAKRLLRSKDERLGLKAMGQGTWIVDN